MKTNILFIVLIQLLVFSCRETTTPTMDITTKRSAGTGAFSYAPLDVTPTQFTLDNSRDTFLVGKTGLIIYVPARAFLGRGSNTIVDLYLKEYKQPHQSMCQRISTYSRNHQLLSANTIVHLEAKQGMSTMALAPNKELLIHFKRLPKANQIRLWQGAPQAWEAMDIDRPKLFNHMLKIGAYNERLFQNGNSIDAWEKQHLAISNQEQEDLWKQDLAYLHLLFTIDKTGKLKNIRFEEPIQHDFQRKILKAMQNYPLCKPHIVDGKAQEVTRKYAFHVHEAEPKYKENLHYLQLLESSHSPLQAQGINHIDQLELKYHVFNIKKMGWLAAAQAVNVPKTVDLVVELEPAFLAEVKIFLKDSKAVLMGKVQGNSILFEDLPQDAPLSIWAFTQQGGQPLLATAEANSSDGVIANLEFSATSYEDIRQALQAVDK
jgi:hypothetical protein